MDAAKLDDALASIEGMLNAAEHDLYENGDGDDARAAAGARTAKVAYIKQAMGDLDDEGRRQLKEAMGLMETGGNKKPGAKDSAGGLDDEDLMDDLGEDTKNAEFPPRGEEDEDRERVGALQAAIRAELGPLRKRLNSLEAHAHRSKSRPLVAKMSRARAAQGWSSERLVDFERRMLNASYPEVKRRYEDEEILLGAAGPDGGNPLAAALAGSGLDYRQALLASSSGSGSGGQLGIPFNGPPAQAAGGALQAAVDAVIDGKDPASQPLMAGGGGQPMVLVPASQVPGALGAGVGAGGGGVGGGGGVVMPMPGQWGA